MGSDMLSDILQALQQFCLRDKTSPMKILSEVAKNPEAGILFMMLGEREKHGKVANNNHFLAFIDSIFLFVSFDSTAGPDG